MQQHLITINDFLRSNAHQLVMPPYVTYQLLDEKQATYLLDLIRNVPKSELFFTNELICQATKAGLMSELTFIKGNDLLVSVTLLLIALRDQLAKQQKTLPNVPPEVIFNSLTIPSQQGVKSKIKFSGDADLQAIYESWLFQTSLPADVGLHKRNNWIENNYQILQGYLKKLTVPELSHLYDQVLKVRVLYVELPYSKSVFYWYEQFLNTAPTTNLLEQEKILKATLYRHAKSENSFIEFWDELLALVTPERLECFWNSYFIIKTGDEFNRVKLAECLKRIDFKELLQYAKAFQKIIDFKYTGELRLHLLFLNAFDTTEFYPLLLAILYGYQSGKLTLEQAKEKLQYLSSYLVRRKICRVDPLCQLELLKASAHNLDNFPQIAFDHTAYPSNQNFATNLIEYDFYGSKAVRDLFRYFLSGLENYNNAEPIAFNSSLKKIEHIMPQHLDQAGKWKKMLGPNWQAIHNKYINRLGNLTLSGYNQEMRNDSFEAKKQFFAKSNISLNRAIAQYDTWDEASIKERGIKLAKRAVEVWPGQPADEASVFPKSPKKQPVLAKISSFKIAPFYDNWKVYLEKNDYDYLASFVGNSIFIFPMSETPECSIQISYVKSKKAIRIRGHIRNLLIWRKIKQCEAKIKHDLGADTTFEPNDNNDKNNTIIQKIKIDDSTTYATLTNDVIKFQRVLENYLK